MSSKLLILFGNQLFPEHPAAYVFMAEDGQLCRRSRYHKHKPILILSAMRSHRDELQQRRQVYYCDLSDRRSYFEKLAEAVRISGAQHLFLPTTRSRAMEWMDIFFSERYRQFGPYEDAIHNSGVLGFHSLLSPLLNIGLLLPEEVISRALEGDVPLPSKEGFIRQIIGWREFIRGVYRTRECRSNFFGNTRRLTEAWYTASTGLPILDDTIGKVMRYGYVHHIERLMVLGNIIFPNVYGMSQYADGGSLATKPYVASSRYLLKMMTSWLDRMDEERFSSITEKAEDFIRRNTV